MRGNHIAHGNGGAEAYAVASGSHLTDRCGVVYRSEQSCPTTNRYAALWPESDASARDAIGELSQDSVRARKAASTRSLAAADFGDRPLQRRFDWRGRFVQIGAVKAQPRLKSQAVARAKPDPAISTPSCSASRRSISPNTAKPSLPWCALHHACRSIASPALWA